MIARRRSLSALMIAAWMAFAGAGAVDARPIRVTSGEHPDFSRLVLYFRDAGAWEFGTVEGGYEFRAGAKDATYDLRRAFEFIPRDRIASLRDLGEGRLFLQVNCRCYGEAFSLDGGQVVLDIFDGDAPPSASKFNQPLAAQTSLGDGDPAAESSRLPSPPARSGLPVVFPGGSGTTWIAALAQPRERRIVETAPQAPPPIAEPVLPLIVDAASAERKPDRVAETEALLLEQIGRAASQGLLEPDLADLSKVIETATPPPSHPDQATQDVVPEDAVAEIAPQAHVRIQNVYERSLPGSELSRGVTSEGLSCPDEALFDVSEWGENPSGGVRIGYYRSRLLAEFDKPAPEATIALAQYYIFLTFGSEAEAVLKTFAPDSGRVKILRMMAGIVDNLVSDEGDAWARFQECSGSAPMWAILAQDDVSPAHGLNEAAVYSAFSALPIHLRQRFGPALAERLVAAGRIELATRLRDAVQRGTLEATPETAFLDAQISMAEEDSDGALRELEEVISSRSGNVAQALIDMLGYKLAHDISPSERDIELAASFAFENQGTDTGWKLQRLEILSLAQIARFTEAFSLVEQLQTKGEIEASKINSVLIGLVEKLAKNGSDAQFLRYANEFALQLELPPATRLAVSERLLELGFYPEAEQVLTRTAQVPAVDERRVFAKLALAKGNIESALGYLTGLDDEVSLSLRAQALLAAGDMAGAIRIFEKLGNTSMLEDLALRSGDWSKLAESEDLALADAARLAMNSTDFPGGAASSGEILAVDSQLLETASETRRVLEGILDRFSD